METKFYLKKNALRFIFLVALVLGFASTNANAQCHAVKLDDDLNIIGMQGISCDFPVLLTTGDATSSVDEDNYANACVAWANANPGWQLPTPARGYIEIHQADFDTMDAARKDAIEQNPNYYHILPD
jgi:hypothetical protein